MRSVWSSHSARLHVFPYCFCRRLQSHLETDGLGFPQLNSQGRLERSPVLSRGLRVAELQEEGRRARASSPLLRIHWVG